jgi:hypothetical protein
MVRREVERLMLAFSWSCRSPAPWCSKLSYYEAQIWAVARLGQVGVILSEDFNPCAVLDGVSFTNPQDLVHSTSPP